MPLPQALDKIISARKYFEDSRNVLRRTLGTERALNGPDGSISNVSMNSMELLEWGLKNLNIQTSKYGFKDIVLESSTTLEAEQYTLFQFREFDK